jgi:putative ABC transport system substrate-binding protein
MNRRNTLLALVAFGARPTASFAQPSGKVWRIGFLDLGSRQSAVDAGRFDALITGMREHGYAEGRNLVFEARNADGNVDRLDVLAADLVRLKVDVIVTFGAAASHAAQRATTRIPIVIIATSDPVRDGFAATLARPGGNITGMSIGSGEIVQKYVELLGTMVPKLSRVAVIVNPTNASHSPMLLNVQLAAQQRGWDMLPVSVRGPDDIEMGFAAMVREHADAVIILPDSFVAQQRRQVSDLALRYRLPSIAMISEYTDAGALMSYGASMNDNAHRTAAFVDRILKGARPGDMPFEAPTRFYLVINRRTATSLGLTIPLDLMNRADRVID